MAQASRTFRVFVSSTFADLKAERDALQERVFPRLRDHCGRHGTRFQAIDLRWGVSEEAAIDQQTIRTCLEEIARCQAVSPRPNFILLLGDRYGWCPPPPEISAAEFDEIRARVCADDAALLDAWYCLDRNAVPAEYYLRPRLGDEKDAHWWGAVERRLRLILERAVADMPLEPRDRLKYEASATELEIDRGTGWSGRDHVFCYFRSIRGLPHDETAADFVDLDGSGRPDAVTHERLTALKRRTARPLPPGNVRTYQAEWIGARQHDGRPLTTDHIDQLCADVYEDLLRIVDEEMALLEDLDVSERERVIHEDFGAERARFFRGRADELARVERYLHSPAARPLVVHGEPGLGKSAFMGEAARRARDGNASLVVTRFAGATPGSSRLRGLLDGVCREIARRCWPNEDDSPILTDERELADELLERLRRAVAFGPVALFVDGVDELSSDGGRASSWLPDELPTGVAIVISTGPGETFHGLSSLLPEDQFIQLSPLGREDAALVLDQWLANSRRALQPHQRAEVLDKFAVEGKPLFLRLAFEEVRRWKSHQGHPEIGLPATIPGIIRSKLFHRLARPENHGEVVVSRGLGYLGAARNGLSEDEMVDLLSRPENGVLVDLKNRGRRSPEVDRLPVVIWSRLFFDLEPYLTERTADGASLITFYHRQFRDAVEETYLQGPQRFARHREVAAHFGGQGLRIGDRPNARYLSEVPYQLTVGEQWDPLYGVLTDFDYQEARCEPIPSSASADEGAHLLQEDLEFALARWPEGRPAQAGVLSELRRAIRREFHTWTGRPKLLFQQLFPYLWWAHEDFRDELRRICASFQPAYTTRGAWIRRLDRPAPAASLELELSAGEQPVTCLLFAECDRALVAGTAGSEVVTWDLQTGRCRSVDLHEQEGSVLRLAHAGISREGFFLCLYETGRVVACRVWPRAARTVLFFPVRIAAADVSGDGAFVAGGTAFGQIEVWDVSAGARSARHVGRRVPVLSVTFSGDRASLLVISASGSGTVYDADTLRPQSNFHPDHPATVALPNPSSGGWWVASRDGRCVNVDGTTLAVEELVRLRTETFSAGSTSRDGRALALGCASGRVVVDVNGSQTDWGQFRLGKQVTAVAVSDDGQLVAAADIDGHCEVHRVALLAGADSDTAFEAITGPTYLADGALVVGAADGSCRWVGRCGEVLDTAKLRTLPGTSRLSGPAAGATASLFWAAGQHGGTCEVWDLDRGVSRRSVGATGEIRSVAVSPDGRIVLTGRDDGWVMACDSGSGGETGRQRLHAGDVLALAFSPNGRELFSAGADSLIRAWRLDATRADPAGGEFVGIVMGTGASTTLLMVRFEMAWQHETGTAPNALACSRDGLVVAYTDEEGVRCMTRAGEAIRSIPATAAGRWTALEFAPDCRSLLGISTDGACCVWDLATGEVWGRFQLPAGGRGASWRPDGHRIAVTTEEGELLFLAPEGGLHGPPFVRATSAEGIASTWCPNPDCGAAVTVSVDTAIGESACPVCGEHFRFAPLSTSLPRTE